MHFKNISVVLFFVMFSLTASAQQENLYLNRNMILSYEKSLNAYDKASFHSAMKPYNAADVYRFVYPDTVQHYERVPHTGWLSKAVNVIGFEDLLAFDENYFSKTKS